MSMAREPESVMYFCISKKKDTNKVSQRNPQQLQDFFYSGSINSEAVVSEGNEGSLKV